MDEVFDVTRIVFVQQQVSQLDEPVYAAMHSIDPESCAVIYLNDYGFIRNQVDPQTGVVPDFVESDDAQYVRTWLDSRLKGGRHVADAVLAYRPSMAVLADIPTAMRIRIAFQLRRHGVRVALRSDKNHLSAGCRRGFPLQLERMVVRATFDELMPTSPLTTSYYGWPLSRPATLFPYATNAGKFGQDEIARENARNRVRVSLQIPSGAFVFVSASKFHERENPWQLVQSFEEVRRREPRAFWIALGDGPLLAEIREFCGREANDRVRFPGFVPFRVLQDYFFAGDAFLHFPVIGPWEVSPQDALVAGLALIATESVGSAQVFLNGNLRRFLVPVGDVQASAERMLEVVSLRSSVATVFKGAASRTADYMVDATARRLVSAAARHARPASARALTL